MRTHSSIIKEHGALALARDLTARGKKVHFSTPQRWAERESIPGEYWAAIADMGLASLDELAQAAAVVPKVSDAERKAKSRARVAA